MWLRETRERSPQRRARFPTVLPCGVRLEHKNRERDVMEMTWEGMVHVAAPIESVYRYLADLPRHREWAQSVERMELQQPGDATGIGARYLTFERQALHADRQPHQSLSDRDGVRETTLAEVLELVPNQRIAWHAHSVPRRNIRADIAFDLTPAPGAGTMVTQRISMRLSLSAQLLALLLFRCSPATIRARSEAQWRASLDNIKAILEEPAEQDSSRGAVP